MTTVDPLCVVSERQQFIYVGIAKNGSSTLRTEFTADHYGGVNKPFSQIAEVQRKTFFSFAVVRDPGSRVLSGYQEISMRQAASPADYPAFDFWQLPDDLRRLEAFIAEIRHNLFDNHIREQQAFLNGIDVNALLRLESLEEDLQPIAEVIGYHSAQPLPKRRSRKERAEVYDYDRYVFHPDNLTPALRAAIRSIYEADYELYASAPRYSSLNAK